MKLHGSVTSLEGGSNFATQTVNTIVQSGIFEGTGVNVLKGCTLVESSFDIFIQGILGLLAFTTLFAKRYMESPRRPFVVWGFDASKQAVAGMTVHILNIGIAEYLTHAVGAAALKSDECDFYFVNFVIDIFVGVTATYLLLAIVGVFAEKFNYEILRTGEYGNPPSPTAFFAQLGVYMLLTVMIKGILFSTEVFLRPYLDVWGYVMFNRFDSFPKLKLVFVMIVTPFILNSVQNSLQKES